MKKVTFLLLGLFACAVLFGQNAVYGIGIIKTSNNISKPRVFPLRANLAGDYLLNKNKVNYNEQLIIVNKNI